ncbi:hypothetical protein Asp14428_56130 [Actinoplanes sp. NBRC 14428]|nr:hypothetical protein Asp14428_56130 [Actinoplanes sp. NBRC 14428]
MTDRAVHTELDLAARVVELTRRLAGAHAEAEVVAAHSAEALTRFANSAIHQNVADATTTVRLRLHVDGRTAGGSTTVTDAEGLRSLVERTLAAARLSPPDASWPGLTPPTPLAPDAGFDEATAGAGPRDRAARVRDFVEAAGGLETAGYCRTTYASGGFANTLGQAVHGRVAEAAMDGIARLAGADGMSRRATSRLADLHGAELGARAAAKARAGATPAELPPGRYEVILEPTAVADLLDNLATFGFNGKSYAQHQSFAEPGTQQFDEAITLTDEPLGTILPFDAEGTPRATLTLVENGTTRAVSHDRTSAAETGTVSTGHGSAASRSWGPTAVNLRLAPAQPPAHDAGPTSAGASTPGPAHAAAGAGSSGPAHGTAGAGSSGPAHGTAGAGSSGPAHGTAGAGSSGPAHGTAGAGSSGPAHGTAGDGGPEAADRPASSPPGRPVAPTAAGPVVPTAASPVVPTAASPVVSSAAGPVVPSARRLVAGMRRGLLVTDLWYTRVLDQKSLVVTGLTRNGVWLVEDGEIVAAVGNLRFTQSYPQALGPGAVLGIGTEAISLPDRWSGVRYTAPALHLASWNFTGNASG